MTRAIYPLICSTALLVGCAQQNIDPQGQPPGQTQSVAATEDQWVKPYILRTEIVNGGTFVQYDLHALPRLADAVKNAIDAKARENAANTYRIVFYRSRADVEGWAASLDDPKAARKDFILAIENRAEVAASVVPQLKALAADPNIGEDLRQAAKHAIDEITKRQLPETPNGELLRW